MKKLLGIVVLGLFLSGCSSTTTTRNIEINKLKIKEISDDSPCKTGSHFSLYLTGEINEDTSLVVEKLLSQQTKCINYQGIHLVPNVYLNSSGGYLKDGFVVDNVEEEDGDENDDEDEESTGTEQTQTNSGFNNESSNSSGYKSLDDAFADLVDV